LKAVKRFLLLTLLLIVFLAFAGCSGGGGGGTPSVSPTASGGYTTREIDYTDDFSDSNSGWGGMGTPTQSDAMYYADTDSDGLVDGYVMKINQGPGRCWSNNFKSKLSNDYIIEVAIKNGLDSEALGGIYFNDNGVNHNVFAIFPQTREYAVAKEEQGGRNWHAMEKIIKPTKCSAIKPNDFNILKVEVKGSQAILSINGQELTKNPITVPTHLDGETVGIYLSNYPNYNVEMIYDNFHVKGTEILEN
jgi:hypothetical protein